MPLAAAIKGRTRPGQRITLQRRGGGVVDLSAATTITGIIQAKDTGASRAIAGTLAVASGELPTAGLIDWDYAAADVATAGYFWVQLTVTFTGGAQESCFIINWEVADAL
jgi:hypothetical protein